MLIFQKKFSLFDVMYMAVTGMAASSGFFMVACIITVIGIIVSIKFEY